MHVAGICPVLVTTMDPTSVLSVSAIRSSSAIVFDVCSREEARGTTSAKPSSPGGFWALTRRCCVLRRGVHVKTVASPLDPLFPAAAVSTDRYTLGVLEPVAPATSPPGPCAAAPLHTTTALSLTASTAGVVVPAPSVRSTGPPTLPMPSESPALMSSFPAPLDPTARATQPP